MDTPRIRMGHAYGEVYPNVFSDFEWVREHRSDLLETYGECVILVYEKQVIGKGHTIQEAAEEAERNLPANVQDVTPITQILSHSHPLARAWLKQQMREINRNRRLQKLP